MPYSHRDGREVAAAITHAIAQLDGGPFEVERAPPDSHPSSGNHAAFVALRVASLFVRET